MPAVTRWYIKASLLYLAAALLLSAWLAAPFASSPPGLSPVFFHFFLVGWVTQMIMGVGFWFFPKFTQAQPRGSEALAWAAFVLLNLGLLLRALAEPWQAAQPSPAAGWSLAVSALLQWLAGLLFVLNTWPRIKER